MILNQIGDRIIGERIVAIYQDFNPKKGYKINEEDGMAEIMLKKSVRCIIEKPLRKKV